MNGPHGTSARPPVERAARIVQAVATAADGLGTAAPALDFGPLVRQLEGYRVVVVEGFGYGYADLTAPERTARNVSQELHSALEAAGVNPTRPK